MFKLPDPSDEPLIKSWPVLISAPQDGGRVAKFEVTADFVMLPQSEIDDLLEQARESDGNVDNAVIDRVVRGLAGFSDTSGNAIPYGPDLVERIKGIPYVRKAIVTAFFDATHGRKAARKN